MKRGITILGALAAMASFVGVYQNSQRATAGDVPQITASTFTVAMMTGGGDAEYVGAKKCKKCHMQQHKSWEETKMGKAFESLKPGVASEIKSKFGLDPQKDYTTDEKCLECHTVGFGKPGGYAVPDPNDKKAIRAAEALEGVGCESCHGPGGAYIERHEEILKSGSKYTHEEMLAAGLEAPDKAGCMKCHNDRSPTKPEKPFDYDSMKDEGIHEHIPLKQRSDS